MDQPAATKEPDSDKENRRRTLDRRGEKKNAKNSQKRKFKYSVLLATKRTEDELQKQKEMNMQHCIILPDETVKT